MASGSSLPPQRAVPMGSSGGTVRDSGYVSCGQAVEGAMGAVVAAAATVVAPASDTAHPAPHAVAVLSTSEVGGNPPALQALQTPPRRGKGGGEGEGLGRYYRRVPPRAVYSSQTDRQGNTGVDDSAGVGHVPRQPAVLRVCEGGPRTPYRGSVSAPGARRASFLPHR